MRIPDFKKSYLDLKRSMINSRDTEEVMSAAVGGNFEAAGQLEYV